MTLVQVNLGTGRPDVNTRSIKSVRVGGTSCLSRYCDTVTECSGGRGAIRSCTGRLVNRCRRPSIAGALGRFLALEYKQPGGDHFVRLVIMMSLVVFGERRGVMSVFEAMIVTLAAAWGIFGAMAPYLLLGFLVAGVLHVVVPSQWVERHLGQNARRQVVKATLLGIPLPLCSCGVLPVAASLYRHKASRGATTAFLAATPQTGVDSIAVTWALLGPIFAVFRVVAAFVTGLLAGWAVDSVARSPTSDCAEPNRSAEPVFGESNRWRQVLGYGLVTLPRDIGKPLLMGVLISGLVGAWLPPGFVPAGMGQGFGAMVLVMLAGIPVYVCSTASVPIALALIHAGFTPGVALVFLVTGPATNAATLSLLWKLIGARATVVFLLAIASCALVSGWVLDGLFGDRLLTQLASPAHAGHGFGSDMAALILLGVLINALRPKAVVMGRAIGKDSGGQAGDQNNQVIEFRIDGMRCSHCVASVQRGLAEVAGVKSVRVALDSGKAEVEHNGADIRDLVSKVEGLGYQPVIKADVS